MSMKRFIEECRALADEWDALATAAEKLKLLDEAKLHRQRAEINRSLIEKFS